MAKLIIRNLEKTVATKLRHLAKRHGRSLEEEVQEILRKSVYEEEAPVGGLGSEIAALYAKTGLASEIPELRGYTIKPVVFER